MYYVYCYRDPFTYQPFYIGKGKGSRCYFHLYEARNKDENNTTNKLKYRKIKKILLENKNPIIDIVSDNLSLKYAYSLERELILYYGRRDIKTGILTNLSDGGDGPLNRTGWNKGKRLRWINKDGNEKNIPIEDLDYYFNAGWSIGRPSVYGKPAWNKNITMKDAFKNRDQSGNNNPTSKNVIWICRNKDGIWVDTYKKRLLDRMGISDVVIGRMFRKNKYLRNRNGIDLVMKIKIKEEVKCPCLIT